MNKFDSINSEYLHDAVVSAFSSCKLTKLSNEYNFRCPICGDSQKDKHKKRGHVYYGTGEWIYKCYNGDCPSEGLSLFSILKTYYYDIYKELLFKGLGNEGYIKSDNNIEIKTKQTRPKKDGKDIFKDGELVSIYDNNYLSNKAIDFCKSRKIREDVYSRWYICLKSDKFLDKDSNGNLILDENGKPIGNEYGGRLIIPYYKYGAAWNQFDARDLRENSYIRYKNLKGVDREFYNIDWLDTSKPFYLLEGAIDSTFIKNSVSFGGVKAIHNLFETHPQILENKHNGVFIWDNDDAGKDHMETTVNLGFKWFNWSDITVKEEYKITSNGTIRTIKDINDLVLYGNDVCLDENGYISEEYLHKYIESPELIKLITVIGDRKKHKPKPKNNINLDSGDPLKKLFSVTFL